MEIQNFSVPKFFCLQSFCQRPVSVAAGLAAFSAVLSFFHPFFRGNPCGKAVLGQNSTAVIDSNA
jgi:hypothetical protein